MQSRDTCHYPEIRARDRFNEAFHIGYVLLTEPFRRRACLQAYAFNRPLAPLPGFPRAGSFSSRQGIILDTPTREWSRQF